MTAYSRWQEKDKAVGEKGEGSEKELCYTDRDPKSYAYAHCAGNGHESRAGVRK